MDFEDIPQSNDETIEFSQSQSNDEFYEDNTTADQSNNYDSFPEPEPEQPKNGYNAFPDPEPEDALAVFNRAWQIKLDAKKATEVQHDTEVKAKATEELANWTTQRKIRLEAKKEKNRSEEQILLETLESEADGGNSWERASKMIDISSTETTNGKADVSRMKKLFIQLKSDSLDKTQNGKK